MNSYLSEFSNPKINPFIKIPRSAEKTPKIEKKVSRLTENKFSAIKTKEKISTKEELLSDLYQG